MQRFSTFFLLILFIIFLTISLLTFNSDFIALCIFCFAIFILDFFYCYFFDNIEIECLRKIYLIENDEKHEQRNNRFVDNQIAEINTRIIIKSKRRFYFKVYEKLPSNLKVIADQFNDTNKTDAFCIDDDGIETGFFNEIYNSKKRSSSFSIGNLNSIEIFSFNFSYKIKIKRGFYELNTIGIEIFGPFFILSKKLKVEAPIKFYATPDQTIDINLPIRSKKLLIYTGMIPSKKAGTGLNFFGVRQYIETDRLNSINWKHFAKTNQLYVNEFERESNTDASIIVDCRNKLNIYMDYEQIFEKGIEAAYCIAKSLLKLHNRVSLLEFGSFFNYVRPGYGKIQLEMITQVLSRIKINVQQDFWELDNIPSSLLPAESLIFLITPLFEDDIPHIIRFHKKKYRFVIIALDFVEYLYLKFDESKREKYKKSYLLQSSLRKITIETAKKAGAIVLNYNCIEPFGQFIRENLFYLKELTRKSGKI